MVDIYQEWCGPSNVLYKVLESVQPKLFTSFLFKSVNYDFLKKILYYFFNLNQNLNVNLNIESAK